MTTLIRRDGHVPDRIGQGYLLDAEHEWVVQGEPGELDLVIREVGSAAKRVGPILLLNFGNAVGRYRTGPLGTLHVRSGKWTEAHYARMLEDISSQSLALPFQAGAPSAVPFARTELDNPQVLYHAFVWLRHAVLEQEHSPLLGALRALLQDPHRVMAREERLVPADRAVNLSDRGMADVLSGVRPLCRLGPGNGFGKDALFPVEVAESVGRLNLDTAENRFVKAFLASCGYILDALRRRLDDGGALALRVHRDCSAIEGELAQILRHRMWGEVGAMRQFPSASTILQRRPAYREILRHHLLLRGTSSALPLSFKEVEQMLEVKDIAKLYELWSAFAIVQAVSEHLGPPRRAFRPRQHELGATLNYGLLVTWHDGTELAYNPAYTHKAGFHGTSWSRKFSPDVVLQVPGGSSAGLHAFDAKFRLFGQAAKVDDLNKMHTYRDAISNLRSAWVIYPGIHFRFWPTECGCGWPIEAGHTIRGVGSVPAVPGGPTVALANLIGTILGRRH